MGIIIGQSVSTVTTWGSLRYVFGNQSQDSDLYSHNVDYYSGFRSSEGNGFFAGPDYVWGDRPWWEVYLLGAGSQLELGLINVIDERLNTALTGETVTFNSGTETIPALFFVPTLSGGLGGQAYFPGTSYTSITAIGKLTAF